MGLLDVFKKAEKKVEEVKKDVDTLAQEVMKGEWGSKEEDIIKKLKEAGYENYTEIKAKVDVLVKKAEDAKKQAEAAAKAAAEAAAKKAKEQLEANRKAKIEELAKEVIQGKWGNGQERYDKLTAAGYNYDEVQGMVNDILHGKTGEKKDLEAIAKEVIQGKWGNGQERKDKLTAAGYDYHEVQALVNKLLG